MASQLSSVQSGKITKSTPKAPYKRPARKYNPAWESLPELANWLNRSPYNDDRAWCVLCERELRTHMTDLKKHRESVKHQRKEYEYENDIVADNDEVLDEENSDEKLREAACYGDWETIERMITNDKDIEINSQNKVNGWTALHWAAKRKHIKVVKMLMEHGADPEVLSNDGQSPYDVTDDGDVKACLQLGTSIVKEEVISVSPPPSSNFVHVQFPIPNPVTKEVRTSIPVAPKLTKKEKIKILKIRQGQSEDPDFIEIDLPESKWNFDDLKLFMLSELDLEAKADVVDRIRKLPNTKLRRDIDVQRLENYTELELIFQ